MECMHLDKTCPTVTKLVYLGEESKQPSHRERGLLPTNTVSLQRESLKMEFSASPSSKKPP